MTDHPGNMRVFVNERATNVARGTTVRDAVRAADPTLAGSLDDGRGYVTDGVGRRIADGLPVAAGAIYRVVVSARTDETPPTV